ncbi:MAG: M48 family metalloprotease [Armatimonadetes bacterium]|nr:M48 family metalloprotease [Armatimonadota bacterium]
MSRTSDNSRRSAGLLPILFLLMVFFLVSDRAEAQLDVFTIDEQSEIKIGRDLAGKFEAEYGVVDSPAVAARLNRIGKRLVGHCARPRLPFTFKALKVKEVNAFALPGGWVYVTQGALDLVKNDDHQLANIMGHEVAHVSEKHSVEKIKQEMTYSLIGELLFSKGDSRQIGALGKAYLMRNYSRSQELDADARGVTFAHKAGFNPNAMVMFLEKLKGMEGSNLVAALLSSHPPTDLRIEKVREQIRLKRLK